VAAAHRARNLRLHRRSSTRRIQWVLQMDGVDMRGVHVGWQKTVCSPGFIEFYFNCNREVALCTGYWLFFRIGRLWLEAG